MLEAAPGEMERLRVLVADDHPDSRLLVQTFLSLLGFSVETACDGNEALKAAARFRPDVVFLDVWMPEMDGVEACLRLRHGPCPPPIPIFGVTADVAQLEKWSSCFDQVLAKPVDLDCIAALVRRRQGELTHSRLH
jgi:two-component system OmpR family response regulator